MYFKKNYHPMDLIYKTQQGNQLWLGDYYAATNLKQLKKHNISSVLTAAAMLKVKYPAQANMNHIVFNIYDLPSYKISQHFDQGFQFIKKGLTNGNVLVHCAAGVSRSSTFILVYLIKQKGYSFRGGLQFVKSKRRKANPNQGFKEQLRTFEVSSSKKRRQMKKELGFIKNQKRTVKQLQKQKTAFLTFMEKEKVEDSPEKTLKSKSIQKKRQTFYPGLNSIIKDYQQFSKQTTLYKQQNNTYKNQSLGPFNSKK